jgi:predicted polyphosphate/ATP-dependent NAD kinase
MSEKRKRTLGLIVNPVAGLGGRVGLKGSDGVAIQRKAIALGAVSESLIRTIDVLKRLKPIQDEIALVTCPAEMGEAAANACGLPHTIIDSIRKEKTTAEDTKKAAKAAQKLGVELLLFAGGDGTARDIVDAISGGVPVLGIPTGVKMQSAVFAINPNAAGELASSFLRGKVQGLREAEVMDIDETALRQGIVTAKLYGYLRIPLERRLTQGAKVTTRQTDRSAMAEIAEVIVNRMRDEFLYVVGPGTTTRAIFSRLELEKTLVGVDVVWKDRLLARDVNEGQLLDLLKKHAAKIIVTPIGGQGYLFGRGNQQISPQVIKQVDRDNIIVVATPNKLDALGGQPFLVDTGDVETDQLLSGYVRVVCGSGDYRMVRVSCTGKG